MQTGAGQRAPMVHRWGRDDRAGTLWRARSQLPPPDETLLLAVNLSKFVDGLPVSDGSGETLAHAAAVVEGPGVGVEPGPWRARNGPLT
ncbi:hypothetical protein PR002_g17750 [Phytophthora rubi]|uniref:Uncharacterized protein n=1 Tax=Phytophthora rubi TaxID=129364 RepID=A0A6A3K4C5_9STRA|nr:hypothetical protein PR002_g17750 [Phytophthora rubi]